MPLFCSACSNLLVVTTTSDTFHFTCSKCARIETPNITDSLRYEDVSGTNFAVFKAILTNASKDPVNPKVFKLCKCGNNTAKQVRLGGEMKLINTCISCSEQWLDGTKESDSIDYTSENMETPLSNKPKKSLNKSSKTKA